MPDLDRTQVSIEANLVTDKANKEIDSLEQRMNDLEKPRTIDINAEIDADKVTKALEDKINSLLKQVNKV